MNPKHRHILSIVAGLMVLSFLIWLTAIHPPDAGDWLPWFLFSLLITSTTILGVPLAGGEMSLLAMTSVAAYLVMGPALAGWAAYAGALVYGLIRYRWPERLGTPPPSSPLPLAGLTAMNATMHTSSILAGGAIFSRLGGTIPLNEIDLLEVLSLLLFGLSYLAVNYFIAGCYIVVRGRPPLRVYWRSLPNVFLYEGVPLIFAPLMALTFTQLGVVQFGLFALIFIASAFIMRNLALTSQRLERRVKELDSLQAVGRALSATLQVENVLLAIYDQVSGLMPARNFYVALYTPERDQVSFPLAVEEGERIVWRTRSTGNGLTEYVLRTRAPLLICNDVAGTLQKLGINHIGRSATCWLGVPILAGDAPLGVIAVQSYDDPTAYKVSHQRVLTTIAAQAAVAIQNARLYAQTDEALARRVQELDSILRTAHEGVLLLAPDWRVLAANRALADLVGVAQSDLIDARLDAPRSTGERPLITLVGYTPESLQADCESLVEGEQVRKQAIVVLGGSGRHVERTLAPVRDREGAINGWLFVFRDVTEEVELARLKEDTTNMLVHDLRSPLTVLKGSLSLMKRYFIRQQEEKFDKLLDMAQHNSDHMLHMVNQLLDISKLEQGQLIVHPEPVAADKLLQEAAVRLAPLANSFQITFEIEAEPNLPPLHVDAQLVGRALNNLVDNAINFSPDGGIVRLWARFDPQTDPEALHVGVSDQGPGIPPNAQKQLFEKFKQVSANAGRRSGTGLGLPFCKLVVEAHGGEIWVESEGRLGEGSTFVMALPI